MPNVCVTESGLNLMSLRQVRSADGWDLTQQSSPAQKSVNQILGLGQRITFNAKRTMIGPQNARSITMKTGMTAYSWHK